MELKLLSKDKDMMKISFMLKDSNPAFANTLRRLFVNEVPTLAIEDVEIQKNSSVMYDETISHRMGLIPITTDLKSYNTPDKCKCEGAGCAQCQLKMTLVAKGPGYVYASSIKSSDPKCKPVFPKMPIAKLLKEQRLELEATAIMGRGKDHMKWSPGLMYYKGQPDIEISSKCDGCNVCVERCPQKVYTLKGKQAIVVKDKLNDCHLCGDCVDICPKNAITIKKNDSEFIFFAESWGQLDCSEILSKGMEIFIEKTDEFIDKLTNYTEEPEAEEVIPIEPAGEIEAVPKLADDDAVEEEEEKTETEE